MLSKRDYLKADLLYQDPQVDFYRRRRCHALLLYSDGYLPEEVAEIVRVDVSSVWRWIQQYRRAGLAGWNSGWGGEQGQRWLDERELAQLDHLLRTTAPPRRGAGWRRKEIEALIERIFGGRYSASALRKLLHRMNWSYQRGRAVYLRRDEEGVAAFHEAVKKLKTYAQNGQEVHPVAMDQCKVRLEGTVGWRRSPIGQQPLAPDNSRGKVSISVYGALHLGSGQGVKRITPWQNSLYTSLFLRQLDRAYPKGSILLLWDSHPAHKGEPVYTFLAEHLRFDVMAFPLYSPEENPQEGVWEQMREAVTHHKFYEDLEALKQAVRHYFRGARFTTSFLVEHGFTWVDGHLYPLTAI